MAFPSLQPFRAGLVAVAIFASFALTSRPASATEFASAGDRNKHIVSEAFDRWAKGGGGFFDELLAEDVIWTIKGSSPSAGTFRGRAVFIDKAVRPFQSRLSTPVRPVRKQVWAEGEHVIVHWDGEGMARDGVPYRNSYAWILRMQSGKAAEVTAFLDLAPYDEVLRRVPEPVSGAPR